MATLAPFDANAYRKTVLAALLRDGVDSGDAFLVYDVPLAVAADVTDTDVATRVDLVWAFWQKSREHPKYGGLVTALLAGHRERAAPLLERASRLALVAAAGRHRSEQDAQRFLALDSAIERLVERFGGVPENKVRGLEELAAASGIGREDVAARLARVTVLRSRTPTGRLGGPPAEVLRQIRADLDEVGQLTGQAAPRSLHDFLGLPPGSSPEQVRRRVEAFTARNRERRPDRLRAVLDDLLTAANRLLVDGDPEAYLDALVGEVAALLRPRLAAAVLVEDTLVADDARHLIGEAEAAGLDPARARTVVARLAAEAGQPMPPEQPPSSSTARPAAPAPTTPTPTAGTSTAGIPATATPSARSGPAPASAWHETLSRARGALRRGRLGEARRELAAARRLAGELLPPLRAVADEIAAVTAEAASHWATVKAALPARRHVEALGALSRLLTLASDEPGPDGQQVTVLHDESRRQVAAADAAVASARGTPDADRVLLRVLDQVADHPGALEALTALGVAPPTAVRAERHGASVIVRWDRSASSGDVRYKVTRVADRRVVGRTPGTDIEDGSAPTGAPGLYEVVAVRAGVSSVPARSGDRPTEATPRAPAPAPSPAEPAVAPTLAASASRGRACFTYAVGLTVVRDDGTPVDEVDVGFAVDPAPPPGVTGYRLLDDGTEVARATFVALPPVTDLEHRDGRLTFSWPPGCTEVLVEFGPDAADGSRKVTNTRYALDGGVPLPEPSPTEVAVRPCTRRGGTLLAASALPRSARLRLEA